MNANELTFGIEIETIMPAGSVNAGPHGSGYQVAWLPEGWLADRDPSISTESGYVACEFVSPVLKGAEGLRQLIVAVESIKARGGKVNASCGLHVHVGFDRSNTATLNKLVTLVANHEKAIFASTGTKKREQGRWCRGYQAYRSASAAAQNARAHRYHVLNLSSNKPTVEFRAFAASLNVTKIVGYIRLCLGLVELAHDSKKVTVFTAKKPVETSPIHRDGEGHTEVTRVFYKLGWTKGRASKVYGDLTAAGAPDHSEVKKEFVRLAKKYDAN